MDYLSIREEEIPDYAKKAIWNLLHAYINSHSQILIYGFPGYGVQAISIFQSQCANMTLAGQSRYNRMFWRGVHKGWESEINCIERFQNAKALAISVVNSYTEDQLMHT